MPSGSPPRHGSVDPGAGAWPDAFARVREEIVRGGAPLTYVGAGLLGKTYCADVRRAGRVAVDIGSIVDTWVGLKTR